MDQIAGLTLATGVGHVQPTVLEAEGTRSGWTTWSQTGLKQNKKVIEKSNLQRLVVIKLHLTSKESKGYLGMHQVNHCQQVEGSDPGPLLSLSEATSRVL